MEYTKVEDIIKTYQGTSFSRTLKKGNGDTWADNELANFVVTDKSANVSTSGDLERDGSETQLSFTLSDDETAKFIGDYLLLVHLIDTTDPEIDIIIAEYHLEFLNKKAV